MMKFPKTKKVKEEDTQKGTERNHDISAPFNFRKTSYVISVGGALHLVNVVGEINEQEGFSNDEVVKKILESLSKPERPDELNTSLFNKSYSSESTQPTTPAQQSGPGSINYIHADLLSSFSPTTTATPSSSNRDTWTCLNQFIPPPVPPRTVLPLPRIRETSDFFDVEQPELNHKARVIENPGYKSPSNSPALDSRFFDEHPKREYDSLPSASQVVHIGQFLPDVLPPARPPPIPRVDCGIQCDYETSFASSASTTLSSNIHLDFTEVTSAEYVSKEITDMNLDDIRQVAEDMDNYFVSKMMDKVGKFMQDAETRMEKTAARIAKNETINTLQREIARKRPSLNLCENNGEKFSQIFEPLPSDDFPHAVSYSLPEDPSPEENPVNSSHRSSYLVHQSSEEETSTRF